MKSQRASHSGSHHSPLRQAVLRGPRRIEVVEAAHPELEDGEVLLRVDAVGVCGSDVHGYTGLNSRRPAGVVMGHEVAGTVVEIGPGVAGLEINDRAVVFPLRSCGECSICRAGKANLCSNRRIYGCELALPGGMATSMRVRASNLMPVPAGLRAAEAALVEPLAVGIHASRAGRVEATSRVLVIGGGPIGFATAIACRKTGADVMVIEPATERRDLALAAGLQASPEVQGEFASAWDLAFDCVAVPATLDLALTAVPPGGTVVMVGVADETIPLPIAPLVTGERTLVGSSAYLRDDFAAAIEMLAGGDRSAVMMVQQTVELDQISDVFEGYATGTLTALKTVIVN